ncbi:MAG: Crp/Fnr family transcriptional regulator [Acidobacteria bacterium]|nr:Crp/Fnr family transcriptional regulator [Acidobacteriota bacterium]
MRRKSRSKQQFGATPQGEIQAALAPYLVERTYSPGEFLFYEHESADGLYIVRQGRVEMTIGRVSGSTISFGCCGPGMLVGTGTAVSGRAREYSARAATSLTAWFVPRKAVLEQMQANLLLALDIGRVLAGETARSTELALQLRQRKLGPMLVGR